MYYPSLHIGSILFATLHVLVGPRRLGWVGDVAVLDTVETGNITTPVGQIRQGRSVLPPWRLFLVQRDMAIRCGRVGRAFGQHQRNAVSVRVK